MNKFQRKQQLTFDEFKRRKNDFGEDQIKASEFAPLTASKIETVTTQPNDDEMTNVAEKLFAAACRSERKLYRTEPIDGPFYIDPHLNEKMKNPRKCMVDRISHFELHIISFGFQSAVAANTIRTFSKANSDYEIVWM